MYESPKTRVSDLHVVFCFGLSQVSSLYSVKVNTTGIVHNYLPERIGMNIKVSFRERDGLL